MVTALRHHHGALSVPDLDAAIEWYRRVLGFAVEQRFTIATLPAEVAMLKRAELRIELFCVPGAAPLPEERRHPHADLRTHGHKHLAFAVPSAAAVQAEFEAAGVDIAFVVNASFGSAVFARDNAGNLLEFVQQPDLWDASGLPT
jgi:methylmalonyl-CoA/ethylmalonyl-CoA epimerase